MNGPDPLERRYRALIRLLPEDHRAARGEELLGLLLDLDEGRESPSLRQAAGVIGLAARLRLRRAAALLAASALVAVSTGIAVTWISGARQWAVTDTRPLWPAVLAALGPLLLTVAAGLTKSPWLFAAGPLAALAAMRFDGRTTPVVVLPAVLTLAAWLLPAARALRALTLSVLAAGALWAVVVGTWRPGAPIAVDARVSLVLAVAGAGLGVLGAGLMARRARGLVRVAAWLGGTTAGLLVPNLAWYMLSGHLAWLMPATLVAAVASLPHKNARHAGRRLGEPSTQSAEGRDGEMVA